MLYRLIIFVIILLSANLLIYCEKEPYEKIKYLEGTDYYPLLQNSYIIYEITEIIIDEPSEVNDTTVYFIKELVDESYLDNQGDMAYRIERFKKYDINNPWEIFNVWSSKLIDNMAQKVEDNVRYVKIRFPVKEDLNWDGNIFNKLDEKRYQITEIHKEHAIGEFVFDSCLVVTQHFSESLIKKISEKEIYAKNIGLIYKEKIRLNSQEVIFDVPIEERITTGEIYIQKVIDYHIE